MIMKSSDSVLYSLKTVPTLWALCKGGMISAVLDDATSVVMISGYKGKKAPLTTDLHVLFHRPMPLGRANIEVKIIKLGNRSATAEGRIYSTDNKYKQSRK